MFPELMNSKLNRFLKNVCEPCGMQLLSFENFKKHCIESDRHYTHYLNQLEGHDGTHAELVCELGIKQEDCQNYDSDIQPSFDNIHEFSSYYGSAANSGSIAEEIQIGIVKNEISLSDIKEVNECATVEEAVSMLGCEESGSEEIRDTLTFTDQEFIVSDYRSSIDEENADGNENDIDSIKESIKLETIELSSGGEIEDFSPKIIDSSVSTRVINGSIQQEYYQGEDDLGSIVEDDITEIDFVKHEVCIAENFVNSSINDNESQDIASKNLSLNHDIRENTYMVEHKRTDKKTHECDICKKQFLTADYVKIHTRIHTGEKPYECDICKKSFTTANYVKIHKRYHTGEKPYECDICKKSFPTANQMIIHKRIHTGEKLYECDVCKKSFRKANYVVIHKRIHTGEKPYECDICKKNFRNAYYMQIHKRIHTGEKPYDCDICKKSFTTEYQMMRHKRIHTGEKKCHECDICKKRFSTADYMKIHKRNHTGEKLYECDICKKSFVDANYMKKHKRIHTGEKPYECDLCKKSFTTANQMIIHKRIHTGEKPYECDICKKSFSQKDDLFVHKRTQHVEK